MSELAEAASAGAVPLGDDEMPDRIDRSLVTAGFGAADTQLAGGAAWHRMRSTAVSVDDAARRGRGVRFRGEAVSGQRPGGNVELFGVKDGHGRWRVFAHQLPHAGGNVGERAATAASRRHASAGACNARYLREWIDANGRRCRLRSRPHPPARSR